MTLLDADVLSLLEYRNPAIAARAEAAGRAGPVAIAFVTRIERLRGRLDAVIKSATAADMLVMLARLAETERFLAGFTVVPFDPVAGAHFDRLSVAKPTRSMGRGDLLTACVALAQNATLATRNVKDFRQVPGLTLDDWSK